MTAIQDKVRAVTMAAIVPRAESIAGSKQNVANVDEDDKHDSWRIALYYCYIPVIVEKHVAFQQSQCQQRQLFGRIRVSPEGINGVLSGSFVKLQEYESLLKDELEGLVDPLQWELDVKYCQLRPDLTVKDQLFDSLSVKATKQVVSLLELQTHANNGNMKQSYSSKRRQKKRQEQQNPDAARAQVIFARCLEQGNEPAPHLSPNEWNTQLQMLASNVDANVVLLDCRNVYESNVGYFASEGVSTVKTNTRKYSELPQVLLEQKDRLAQSSHVFMYCTGGVRCERASLFLQTLLEEEIQQTPKIYQLHGGIQRYLESTVTDSSEGQSLFRGKNFVFDPRRTDPIQESTIVGQCLVCSKPHDDYDNGHAPVAGKEARCWNCRILILVCNDCRPTVSCCGDSDSEKPRMHCGGKDKECLHMPPAKEI